MTPRLSLVAAAIVLALSQLPLNAAAQPAAPAASPAPAAPAASVAAKAPVTTHSPSDWIQYEDTTYTPVVDDVSRALAEARAALAKKDNAKAAEALQSAARSLQAQADKVAKVDRQRAAADIKLARETHARMVALTRKLDATAAQVKAGMLPTTAALDKTLDKAARADLERRWLVTDVTGWYPVSEEPQRHFAAAVEAYAKKDYKASAVEVRKAASFLRLESARAVGDAKKGLDAAGVDLDNTARALDRAAVKSESALTTVFARAEHALAVAHRAKAAESWAHKAYDSAGYELEAASGSLKSAAAWTGGEAKSAADAAVGDAHAIGDKLARGGVWAKDEVAKGFDSLAASLNKLGQTIGGKSKASPFDVGG